MTFGVQRVDFWDSENNRNLAFGFGVSFESWGSILEVGVEFLGGTINDTERFVMVDFLRVNRGSELTFLIIKVDCSLRPSK